MKQEIFRSYDIRGIYPLEFDEKAANVIARAYARWLKKELKKEKLKIAVGHDIRLSSPKLFRAAVEGLLEEKAGVVDIGTISTDMLYFAVPKYDLDGGFTITASHNPRNYNGMKIVKRNSIPVSSDSGLSQIKNIASKLHPQNFFLRSLLLDTSALTKLDISKDYLDHVLSFIDRKKIEPFTIVANANFGIECRILKNLVEYAKLPINIIPLNCHPDGFFPKGRPDPLIPESRDETSCLVRTKNADLAVDWDADADRCFFFDSKGDFVHPTLVTGQIATHLIKKYKKNGVRPKIIHDTRIVWPVEEAVKDAGGNLILSKAGHTFMKAKMRETNAIFGGETSGHYYFQDNFYADNGMIPFLLLLEILSTNGFKLDKLNREYKKRHSVSDEINFMINEPCLVLEVIKQKYGEGGVVSEIDGIAVDFSTWRFSLRISGTESLLRLNVETKGDDELLKQKIFELTRGIKHINPLKNIYKGERPWGEFTRYTLNETSTVKIIKVDHGEKNSLQYHRHRAEMWVALDDNLEVIVDDKSWYPKRFETVYISPNQKHRLICCGKKPAYLLEICFGHDEESDNVRLEDKYGRK